MTKFTDQGVVEVKIPPEVIAEIDRILRVDQLPATLTTPGDLRTSVQGSAVQIPTDAQNRFAGNIAIHPSAVRTASGSTGNIDVGRFSMTYSCMRVTAISGMASCDVFLEGILELTGEIYLLHHTNFTATGRHIARFERFIFRLVRARWAIITPGVSPSITFSVELQGKV